MPMNKPYQPVHPHYTMPQHQPMQGYSGMHHMPMTHPTYPSYHSTPGYSGMHHTQMSYPSYPSYHSTSMPTYGSHASTYPTASAIVHGMYTSPHSNHGGESWGQRTTHSTYPDHYSGTMHPTYGQNHPGYTTNQSAVAINQTAVAINRPSTTTNQSAITVNRPTYNTTNQTTTINRPTNITNQVTISDPGRSGQRTSLYSSSMANSNQYQNYASNGNPYLGCGCGMRNHGAVSLRVSNPSSGQGAGSGAAAAASSGGGSGGGYGGGGGGGSSASYVAPHTEVYPYTSPYDLNGMWALPQGVIVNKPAKG
jgi:hypothetical protein